MNSAALAQKQGLEDESRFDQTLEKMHKAVHLMADLASVEDGQELAAELSEHPGEVGKAGKVSRDKQAAANPA